MPGKVASLGHLLWVVRLSLLPPLRCGVRPIRTRVFHAVLLRAVFRVILASLPVARVLAS